MMAIDWTLAFHVGLVESQTHCTACGLPSHPAYYHIVVVAGDFAVPVRHCQACHAADPQLTQVLALLGQRYGAQESTLPAEKAVNG